MTQSSKPTNSDSSQQPIDAEFTVVEGEAEGASQYVNDNQEETPSERRAPSSVEEALQVRAYEDLMGEERDQVDAIIATIDPFDLETIFSLGKEVRQRHTDILEQIVQEQDKQGGFFERFRTVTTANSEAEEAIQSVYERAKKFAETGVETTTSVLSKAKNLVAWMASPVTGLADRWAKKGEKPPEGVGADEYRARKEAQEARFGSKHKIAVELEQDILKAASERRRVVNNLEEVKKAIPTLRRSFEGLVESQVALFDEIECFIIAGREAARRIQEDHLPAYIDEAKSSKSQAKRQEAEDLQNAHDLLVETTLNLEAFRQSAVSDGIAFQARKKNLARVEMQVHSQLVNMEAVQGRLVKLRAALTGAKLEEIISEARNFETKLLGQDTSLNNALAQMFENNNDDIGDKIVAMRENFKSQKRVVAKQHRATRERRLLLAKAKENLAELTHETARLSLVSEEDMERLAQEVEAEEKALSKRVPLLGRPTKESASNSVLKAKEATPKRRIELSRKPS